jgi:hypothetical protein
LKIAATSKSALLPYRVSALLVFLLCVPSAWSQRAKLADADNLTSSEPRTKVTVEGRDIDNDSPDKVRRRDEWFMLPRILPGKSSSELLRKATEYKFKQRALRAEMEKVRRQIAAAKGTTVQRSATVPVGDSSTLWIPMGPRPIVRDPADTQNYGSLAGRVSAVTVDQADTSGATVYVGGAYGGVWRSVNATAAPSAVTWTPIIDDQATLSVGAIAVNGNTILVGTGEAKGAVDSYYGLGILRSTDGGSTWTLIQTADSGATKMAGLGFSHIVFNKDNPNNIVATTIGTGVSVGLGALTGNYVRGVFYSTDAGVSWHSVNVAEGGTTFQASTNGLVYNATEHKFFAAMRYHGFYSSPDGATWTRTSTQPGTITLANCPSVFNSSASPNPCPMWRGEITQRPDKDEMYVWFANDSYTSQGVYKTTTGGAAWTKLTTTGADSCDDVGTCTTYQLFYNMTMAALPNKSDTDPNATDIYIGSGNLFKCTVNAANPTCAGAAEPYKFMDVTHVYRSACYGVAQVHPDQHAIAYSNTTTGVVYFGNDGGIYRTLNSPAINTQSCSTILPFDNLNDNIGSLTQLVWATPDPTDSTGVIAGSQDNGTSATGVGIRSAHGISGQVFYEMMSGDGGHTEIRGDVSPNTWYQSFTDATINMCSLGQNCGYAAFAASTFIDNTAPSGDNLGGDSSAFYAPYMVDKQSPAHFIVGTCRVWRGNSTTPFGGTAISYNLNNFDTHGTGVCGDVDSLGNSLSKISALAMGGPITANGSQVIYAALDNGDVFMTLHADNGVSSWTRVTPPTSLNWGASAAGFAFTIPSLVVDPADATGQTVYAAVQGFGANHVLMSTNGGVTWSGIAPPSVANGLPDAPVNTIAIDPDDHTVVYVGSDVGVFVTTDGGASWKEVGPTEPGGSNSGFLPNSVVTHIEFSRVGQAKTLIASTYGRGVWSTTIPLPGLIKISPTSHDFGTLLSGTTQSQAFTLTNAGTITLTLNPVAITGAGAAQYSHTDNCPSSLAVAATCTVTVKFAPTTLGSFPASLDITDTNKETFSAALTAVGTAPVASLSATSHNFGNLTINRTTTQPFTLTNTGTATLNISSIAMNFTPPLSSGFNFSSSDTCLTTSQLAPSASCTLDVQFAPTTTTQYSATVMISDDSGTGTQTVGLTGTGVLPFPAVAFTPASLSFQNTVVTNSATPQTTTLSNSGTADLVISTVTVTPNVFSLTSNSCNGVTLAHDNPASTCSIVVNFTPNAVGAFSGQVVVNSNVAGGTSTMPLNGQGVPAGSIGVTQPATYRTTIGTTQAQTLTVTNTGGSAVSSLTVNAPAGTSAGAFVESANNCPSTLVPGATCTFVVTYTAPAAAATNMAATITVSAVDVAAIQITATVSLTGVAEDFQNPSAVVHGGTGTSATVTAGGTVQFDTVVAPLVSTFSSPVVLSCSGLPSASSCSFNPASVTPGSGAATSVMTINTVASTRTKPFAGGLLTTLIILMIGPGIVVTRSQLRRKKLIKSIVLGLSLVLVLALTACGGGGGGSTGGGGGTIHTAGTPIGTYTIVVTATSGSVVHSSSLSLTVQ